MHAFFIAAGKSRKQPFSSPFKGARPVVPVLLLLLSLLVWVPLPARALILVREGNEPMEVPGWPVGATNISNLKSRFYAAEGPPFGGGQWTLFYRGDQADLQAAVDAFQKIEADRLEVYLHEGESALPYATSTNVDGQRYNWSFEVWERDHWERLHPQQGFPLRFGTSGTGKSVPAPRLDVWLKAGALDWHKVRLAEKGTRLEIIDQRASSHGFPRGSATIRAHVVNDGQLQIPRLQIVAANRATNSQRYEIFLQSGPDRSGEATLTNLPPDTYQISLTAPGYVPLLLGYFTLEANAYREFTERLLPAVRFEGRVLDENDHPVAGAKITVENNLADDGTSYPIPTSPTTVSDPDGRFTLDGIPTGKFRLTVFKDGYHHAGEPADFLSTTQTTPPGGWVARLVATGTVRAGFVDAEGKPLSGISGGQLNIHIQQADREGVGSWGGSAEVSADGTVQFLNVPPGIYRLSGKPFSTLSPDAYQHAPIIRVEAGRTNTAGLRLQE